MAVNSVPAPTDYNRNLYLTFTKAYPEVSARMFRDIEVAAKMGLKVLPSFVATRIGLFLLRRFHAERVVPLVVEVEGSINANAYGWRDMG
jgi:hypothetical protein